MSGQLEGGGGRGLGARRKQETTDREGCERAPVSQRLLLGVPVGLDLPARQAVGRRGESFRHRSDRRRRSAHSAVQEGRGRRPLRAACSRRRRHRRPGAAVGQRRLANVGKAALPAQGGSLGVHTVASPLTQEEARSKEPADQGAAGGRAGKGQEDDAHQPVRAGWEQLCCAAVVLHVARDRAAHGVRLVRPALAPPSRKLGAVALRRSRHVVAELVVVGVVVVVVVVAVGAAAFEDAKHNAPLLGALVRPPPVQLHLPPPQPGKDATDQKKDAAGDAERHLCAASHRMVLLCTSNEVQIL
eukprot:Rhum_TRINITY_DN14179_c2_g1::Rhum_TRINITY_DN14179_c2_g1_i1::g.72279::m.72279